jgi:Holliday junction resolvase RusA-like endonuclease
VVGGSIGRNRALPARLSLVPEWKFFVAGDPVPQGSISVFNGRVVHQNDAKLKAWRRAIALSCGSVMAEPLEGSVAVSVAFSLKRPKSVKRALPHVKPDLDKLARAVLDGLTGRAFADDSQVVSLKCWKRYGTPGAEITVMSLS